LDGKRWESIEYTPDDMVNISEVCRNVVTALAPDAIRVSKMLDLEVPDIPVWINGLTEPLEGAVRNLIENGIVHSTPKSSVNITVTQEGRVSVADQGPGMGQFERERILDPDLRLDRRGAHMGLGLEIVKSIAKAHNATFDISSEEGSGSIFSLEFPTLPTDSI